MITKERIAELRAKRERFVNGYGSSDGAMLLHGMGELLDAAESALALQAYIDKEQDWCTRSYCRECGKHSGRHDEWCTFGKLVRK